MLLRHGHADQLVADHGDDGGLARLGGGHHLGDRENWVRLVGAATLIPDGDRLVEVVLVKVAQVAMGACRSEIPAHDDGGHRPDG